MIDFLEVEHLVQALKKQVAAGQIDQATFEAHLLDLIDVAPDGYYWMFGHETETWYRHDGQQWLAADPGELIMMLSHHNSSGNTHRRATDANPNWANVEPGWFVASLILLGLIAWIVYSSAL